MLVGSVPTHVSLVVIKTGMGLIIQSATLWPDWPQFLQANLSMRGVGPAVCQSCNKCWLGTAEKLTISDAMALFVAVEANNLDSLLFNLVIGAVLG